MGFSSKQVRALRRNVEERHIRTREAANGRELSYLEGWYVLSEANRIFGFDGWSRETVESKCILARENRGFFIAVYTAKVRVTVIANGAPIIREGHGTGEGRGDSPGEVHDTALKAAETDATKRALATFGRPFGLELYRGRQAQRRRRLGENPSHSARLAPVLAADAVNAQSAAPAASGRLPSSLPPVDAGAPPSGSPAPLPVSEAPELAPVAKYARDDTTPIPRPSTYYGRDHYHDARKEAGGLVRSTSTTENLHREESAAASANPQAGLRAEPRSVGSSEVEVRGKINKSTLAFGEPKRIRDKAHLRFVASQPCLVCGRLPADAHHLRFAQPRAIGLKVSDEFTVPLCRVHHRQLHQRGQEVSLWEEWQIKPLEIARRLWAQSHSRLAAS